MTRISTSIKIQKGSESSLFQRGIWEPSLIDWRDIIKDYLHLSRIRFNNKLAMMRIQLQLMQDIIQCQNEIVMYKDVMKNPSNIEKYIKPDDVVSNDDLKNSNRKINIQKVLIKSLRDIADGHLWRIFNYNRSLMHQMGRQPGTGYISIESGGLNELYAWADSILDKDISHFILNELTNSAKIGDVIIKRSNGHIEVTEIKSSDLRSGRKQKERLQKQEKRLKNFESLANTGIGDIQGVPGKIITIPVAYKTSLEVLVKLLTEANKKGISGKKIGNYLSMVCADYSIKIEEKRVMNCFKKYAVNCKSKSDRILNIDTSIRNRYSPNFTPLSIFPIPVNYIADLLLGKKQIFYSVNISEIFRIFEKHNWKVVSSFMESAEDLSLDNKPFCTLKKKKVNIDLPWTIPNQIIFDLLDINSTISTFDYTYQLFSTDKIRLLINYSDENQVWK